MTCYCAAVRPFATQVVFVLLVHPKERRKRIGTAKIVRQCITNSEIIVGDGPALDEDLRLAHFLGNPEFDPVILYPGKDAHDLSRGAAQPVFRSGKAPVIFVIDGTWHQARKMIRTSRLLGQIRQIAFEPSRPSQYRIREQPKQICVSTLEAVHAVTDRLAELGLCSAPAGRAHDNLLEVFSLMVDRQLDYEARS